MLVPGFCISDGDHVPELRWVVVLEDNTHIFQQGDPGHEWIRLKAYLEEYNIPIKDLYIQFRGNIKNVPHSDEGYFFTKAAGALLGDGGGVVNQKFVTGALFNGKLKCQIWLVPELELLWEETRDLDRCEHAIVRNPQFKEIS